jgi:hypothetical protein
MSYEGSEEYLCAKGHYMVRDAYADDVQYNGVCKCGAPIAYWHQIDDTNGVIEDNPGTMPAPTKRTGWEDRWHMDHYGNRYATRTPLYKPKEHWRPYAVKRERAADAREG